MEGNGTLLPLLSTDVPERPTVGPRSRSLLVPPSLLEELARLDTKFKRRETELAHQRSELEKERGRFEQAVATREWALQKEDQRLTEQKEAFRASQEQAISVSAYQDARLTIIASGGEPQSTTLETLSKREPNSGLAAAARTLLAAGVPSGAGAAEPTLYVDRDAVPTQLVLEWLRDGNEVLVPLPRAVLQQMKLEAQHWQMESMGGQVAELLGKIGGGADGLNELEWTVGQLHLHKLGQPALCRAAADKLRRWLAHSRERRRTAARVGASVYVTVVEVIEAHATDLHLLISGLGCAVLLGSEPEGRVQMRKVKPRLEGIAKGAKQLAARTMAEGGERNSSTEEHGGEDEWEQISRSVGSASDIGSACGDDTAIDALADDWALIGTIGEDRPSEWDRLPEYDGACFSGRPSTPSLSKADKTLAELLCAGPFAGRAGCRRRSKCNKSLRRSASASFVVVAPVQGAPSEKP